MRKKIIELLIVIAIISIMVFPASAIMTPPTKSQGKPFDDIWTAIMNLQGQINTLTGTCSCEVTQADFDALKQRVEILENMHKCPTGFTDCGHMDCKNLQADPYNCGGCGLGCPMPPIPNSAPTCVGGHCVGWTCHKDYANCDGNPTNGCEVNIGFDDTNYGGCGIKCSGCYLCTNGVCIPKDLASDPKNCGS